MGALDLQTVEPTNVLVLHWRLEQLVRAGFHSKEAEILAERRDIDLHQATWLLRNGCSPELAVEILL
jgi:hypothetical protein